MSGTPRWCAERETVSPPPPIPQDANVERPVPGHSKEMLLIVGAAPANRICDRRRAAGSVARAAAIAAPGRRAEVGDTIAACCNHVWWCRLDRSAAPGRPGNAQCAVCECSPPGLDMPLSAWPASAASPFVARSPSETIPISRLLRFNTGRRRTCSSAIL